jgi:diguanylate cyclase (GGDEF)-like protein
MPTRSVSGETSRFRLPLLGVRRSRRRSAWAAIGAVLSLGSPIGAAFIRMAGGATLTNDLSENRLLYAYMTVGTLVAFASFGWVLGRAADRLAEDRRALRIANRQLRRLSQVDALTGLLNRGAIDARLEEETLRSRREHTALSLIMLDIDHFKRVNDEHGHVRGDEVLRALAQRVRKLARTTDIVGRYGGEEFLLVLPHTGNVEAEGLAERLRAHVAETPVAGLPLTASFGVTTCPSGESLPPLALVERADSALYRAKNAGRNRVAAFSSP